MHIVEEALFNVSEILNALRGQFSPNQLSVYLNMAENEIITPENYVVWFHERFHYLETIFSSYGHLKWSSLRTVTSDIVDMWSSLTKCYSIPKKIPIAEYLHDPCKSHLKVLANVWKADWMYQMFPLFEKNCCPESLRDLLGVQSKHIGPTMNLNDNDYQLKGIDILESFAKFQEGILGELIGYRDFSETLNTSTLNSEYYSALYYFIEKVGEKRIWEFPIACELSLMVSRLPMPNDNNSIMSFSIGHRFSVIVEYLSDHPELNHPDIHSDKAFFSYANQVLLGCGFESYEAHWDSAKKYMAQQDLDLAKEMNRAIDYKLANPWMLSFPFKTLSDFISPEFNSFSPLFTITNDAVLYHLDSISPTEIVFENHLQALCMQICGRMSNRCIYPNMLQCGFSYFGTNDCPHMLSGECDGHINKDSSLPKLICDSQGNIMSGCTLELVLLSCEANIKEIEIGNINQQITMTDISNALKKLKETADKETPPG